MESSEEVFKTVEELKMKRKDGLFYLQDFLDGIAEADAKWFAKRCEDERRRLGITLK